MQAALNTPSPSPTASADTATHAAAAAASGHPLTHYQIIRRNGAVVPFEPQKIAVAMMKAFLAVHGTQGAASASVREVVDTLTQNVVRALMRSRPGGGTFHIEDVQDQVELGLMRGEHHEVARAYVLYRERRTQERAHHQEQDGGRERAAMGPLREQHGDEQRPSEEQQAHRPALPGSRSAGRTIASESRSLPRREQRATCPGHRRCDERSNP